MAKKFLIDDQSNDYGKARKKSCDSMLKTKTKCFAIDNSAEADENLLGTIIIISAGHQDKTAKQQTQGASRHPHHHHLVAYLKTTPKAAKTDIEKCQRTAKMCNVFLAASQRSDDRMAMMHQP